MDSAMRGDTGVGSPWPRGEIYTDAQQALVTSAFDSDGGNYPIPISPNTQSSPKQSRRKKTRV